MVFEETITKGNPTFKVCLEIVGKTSLHPEVAAKHLFPSNNTLVSIEDHERQAEVISAQRSFDLYEGQPDRAQNTIFEDCSLFYVASINFRSHHFLLKGEHYILVSAIPLNAFQCIKDYGQWKAHFIGRKRAFFSGHHIFSHFLKNSLQFTEDGIEITCNTIL